MDKNNQFSQLSIDLTTILSKNIKKSNGIYFTPKSIINRLLNKSLPLLSNITNINILEPSCGTCEIVKVLDETLNNVNITCVELNSDIYNKIIDIEFKNNIEIFNQDYIQFDDNNTIKYDFIVGNPPYFVCKKEIIPKQYKEYIVGRPNMFGLFIIHSLNKLTVDGILSFVIPKSFLNSAYYSSIRNYIKRTCEIMEIEDYQEFNDFLGTEQSTFGLILRKLETENDMSEITGCKYSILLNGNFIFTNDSQHLQTYFNNSTTIKQLGLSVKTGTIVWNEKKDLLTDNELDTILLYNTNITNDNKIKLTNFKNDEKKQHINIEGSTEPIIVVNRGNGNASYNFKYALINRFYPCVIENHLNIIYSKDNTKKNELLKLYKTIIDSFENPKTKEFIEIFFGNNGLSKTELETILPIYL